MLSQQLSLQPVHSSPRRSFSLRIRPLHRYCFAEASAFRSPKIHCSDPGSYGGSGFFCLSNCFVRSIGGCIHPAYKPHQHEDVEQVEQPQKYLPEKSAFRLEELLPAVRTRQRAAADLGIAFRTLE